MERLRERRTIPGFNVDEEPDIPTKVCLSFCRLGMVIWLSVVIDASHGASGDSCGKLYEYAVWSLCVNVFVILMYMGAMCDCYAFKTWRVVAPLDLVSMVWIMVSWTRYYNDECRAKYHSVHNHLYWFIQVNFWSCVASLCFYGLLAFCMCCCLCCVTEEVPPPPVRTPVTADGAYITHGVPEFEYLNRRFAQYQSMINNTSRHVMASSSTNASNAMNSSSVRVSVVVPSAPDLDIVEVIVDQPPSGPSGPSPSGPEEAQRDKTKCVMCLDRDPIMAFVPCGHKVSCIECARKVLTCPVCRMKISARVRVYD